MILFFMAMLMIQTCAAQPVDVTKKHHTRSGFKNVYPFTSPSSIDFLKWRWQRKSKDIPDIESYHFPLAENDSVFLKTNREKKTITWIGHSTLLLQVGGLNILTDPIFSERASPFQWTGPKRAAPPGLKLEDLPPIDIVLISHDHYDHLDKTSIKHLFERPGGKKTRFYVPLKLKSWFEDLDIKNVVELDWWDHSLYNGLKVHAVPIHHWSKRNLFSENKSLWAGWEIKSIDFNFFFIGDTGYSPVFKDIATKLGPIDLCAIPIGAYEPRWFMSAQHVSPKESLIIHQELKCKKSIGIHWGTFILTDEPLDEPPRKLKELQLSMGISERTFSVLQHGETLGLD